MMLISGELFIPSLALAEVPKSKAQLKFLFRMGNDMARLKDFYCNNLELVCTGAPEQGYLDVNLGAISLLFFQSDYEIKTPNEFAWQPGYKGSDANLNSFSLAYTDEGDFRSVIKKLQSSQYPKLKNKPEWRRDSYWGFTVRDPMNTTFELYFIPTQRPDSLEWK